MEGKTHHWLEGRNVMIPVKSSRTHLYKTNTNEIKKNKDTGEMKAEANDTEGILKHNTKIEGKNMRKIQTRK